MKIIFILLLIIPNKVIAKEYKESDYIKEIASLEYLNELYVDKIKELEGQVSTLIGNIRNLSLTNTRIKNELNETNKDDKNGNTSIKEVTVYNNRILFSIISTLFIFIYILYVRKKSIKKKV